MQGGHVALFGAGQNGRWAGDYLKQQGCHIDCFIDNNASLQGALVDGIPVVNYQTYRENYGGLILVTAKHAANEILHEISDNENAMSFDNWFCKRNAKDYAKVRSLLEDEYSKETLDALLKSMQTGISDYVANMAVQNQYFCIPGFFNTLFDIFVDIGTCTGDSIERFIWAMSGSFKKIYAFEMGNQISAAKFRVDRLMREWGISPGKIVLEHMGISNINGWGKVHKAEFRQTDSLEISSEGGDIEIRTIDSYFYEKEVTLLKADIEGAEVQMIQGAKSTIIEQKPRLAICVYHRPDDLFNIIKLLREYVPEYKFYLRHHSSLLVETVLYCKV